MKAAYSGHLSLVKPDELNHFIERSLKIINFASVVMKYISMFSVTSATMLKISEALYFVSDPVLTMQTI
jgi:hypothetical protein